MNVFHEMPLNKAHHYERLIEKCLQSEDHSGAIKFCKDASASISKAMEVTYSVNCLLILQLQYDHYLSVIKDVEHVLECKAREAEEIANLTTDERFTILPSLEITSVDGKQETIKSPKGLMMQNKKHPMFMADREPDSLLQFLSPKIANKVQKCPKDDNEKFEELQIQNENLLRMVKTLAEENERLKIENRTLQDENEDLRNQRAVCQNVVKQKSLPQNEDLSNNFMLDRDQASGFQPQSFFYFDDPILVHEMKSAMNEDDITSTASERNSPNVKEPVVEPEPSSHTISSQKYEDVIDS